MRRFVCLLRGINVSGHRKIKMAELKVLFEGMGLDAVQTYLQSGNVVFESDEKSGELSTKIEQTIEAEFGYAVNAFVFEGREFVELIEPNPLAKRSDIDPQFLHVTFCAKAASPIDPESLPLGDGERAVFRVGHYFLYCPNGYGRTKINNGYFERKLGVDATTRNWKTVQALVGMV